MALRFCKGTSFWEVDSVSLADLAACPKASEVSWVRRQAFRAKVGILLGDQPVSKAHPHQGLSEHIERLG